MATVRPEELLRLWTRESMSSDMAVGHIIQNLVLQHSTIATLQATVASLRATSRAAEDIPVEATPSPAARKKPRRR